MENVENNNSSHRPTKRIQKQQSICNAIRYPKTKDFSPCEYASHENE